MSTTVIGSSAYGTADTTTSSQQSSSKLSADFDTFLLLLTTQLKNQDPLSPMDSTEFTNQLVQYAEVEQAIQTNSNLESLLALNTSNLATNAVSYIGKTVQTNSSAFALQDGYTKFSYTLPEDATTAIAIIYDTEGNIIDSFTVESTAGKHILDWDGITGKGEQLEDGVYKLGISAFNGEGELMDDIYITTYGKVTAIASDGVDIAIGMDDLIITLDYILSIHETDSIRTPVPDADKDGTGSGTDGTEGENGGNGGENVTP